MGLYAKWQLARASPSFTPLRPARPVHCRLSTPSRGVCCLVVAGAGVAGAAEAAEGESVTRNGAVGGAGSGRRIEGVPVGTGTSVGVPKKVERAGGAGCSSKQRALRGVRVVESA